MYYLIIVGLSLFFWEHFARIGDVNFRPTICINYVTDILERFFTSVGQLFSAISSYLYWINFHEFWISIVGLFESLYDFVASPCYIIKGYVNSALEYDWPYKIYVGSALLICVGLCIVYRYRERIPFVRSFDINTINGIPIFLMVLCISINILLRSNVETFIFSTIGGLCIFFVLNTLLK